MMNIIYRVNSVLHLIWFHYVVVILQRANHLHENFVLDIANNLIYDFRI